MIIIIKAFIILWRMIWIRHWLRKYSRPWQHLRPIAFSLCRRTAVLRRQDVSPAYLVVKEPLRAVQVRRFLREQGIAEFKLPDRVECVDSLPLTAVGKVDKKQLRQWLASRASA